MKNETIQFLASLADFKRAIQPGARIKTTYHLKIVGYSGAKPENTADDLTLNPAADPQPIYGDSDMGDGTVVEVNSVGFKVNRNGRTSGGEFGKADCWRFDGNKATKLQPDLRGLYGDMNEAAKTAPKIPVLTYELLS